MSYEKEQAGLWKLWEEFEDETKLESDEEHSSDGELDIIVANADEQGEENDVIMQEQANDLQEGAHDFYESRIGNQKYFYDKNGNKWLKESYHRQVRTRTENIIVVLPGVKRQANSAKTPIDCWRLFVDDNMIADIVECTNRKIVVRAQTYNADHLYMVK
ncbi:hypothetical protein QE152_g13357 [Popillia japonica]|uniref:Uncharacterized protein n=1 Tax=Popillia japonica TaxID=7064 RepID=A0AAW1LCF2_POPJA